MGPLAVLSLLAVLLPAPPAQRGSQKSAKPAGPYKTTLSLAQMIGKEAVVTTSAGKFTIGLRPDLAPNHVGYFITLAREGAYNGTTFHRLIRLAIVQGGDPLSRDPTKAKLYGTGGLGRLAPEFSSEPATRGAVAAVLQPNRPDSAGAQFFVCITDQRSLDGKYTVFGRVTEGMAVVERISESEASAEGIPAERIVIESVTIRDTPPPEPEPFSQVPASELGKYRAVLETSAGPMTLEFFPELAPGHVRNFLRLAQAGAFDGTAFHRVVRGFVVQGGALNTRGPLSEKQEKYVRTLPPEFSGTPHVKGILSMARGDDPASAMTSFFIVTGDASSLDNKYTVFGRVIDGMAAVEAMDQAVVNGETPVDRIELKGIRIVR